MRSDMRMLQPNGWRKMTLWIVAALLGCGKSASRIAPPLVLDQYDVDTGMGILEECLGGED